MAQRTSRPPGAPPAMRRAARGPARPVGRRRRRTRDRRPAATARGSLRVGAAAAAGVPRLHLLLRRAAEAGQPELLQRQQPLEHPGPADRVHTDQPRALAPGTPPALRRAHRHRHRAGRARGRPGRASRALDPGGGGGRYGALPDALPDGELPLLAVLHRRRHRLPLRLDPPAARRLGRRALPRRADRGPGGGREQGRAADRRPDPLRAGPAGLRPLHNDTCTARGGSPATSSAARSWSTTGAASCSAAPTPSTAGRSSSAAPRSPHRPWSAPWPRERRPGWDGPSVARRAPGGGGTSALSPGAEPAPPDDGAADDHDDGAGRDTTTAGRRRRHADRPGQPGAGRRRGDLHGPGNRRPRACPATRPRTSSSPTTPSARTPAARSGTRRAPSSSCARATARSSTPRRAPWSARRRRGASRRSTWPSAPTGRCSPTADRRAACDVTALR